MFFLLCVFRLLQSETTKVFQMQHSFDGSEFTNRGSLEVYFHDDGLSPPGLAFEDTLFSADDVITWKESVLDGGYYTLRLHNAKTGQNFYTSMPSCFLAKNSRENLILHSDRSGNFVGVGYKTTRDSCKDPAKLLELSVDTGSLISGIIKFGRSGESPVMEIQDDTQQKEKQGSQSLFGRYWWVMLLMMAFMTLTNAAADPGAGAPGPRA